MFEDGQRARDGAESFTLIVSARTPREGAGDVARRACGRLVASYARDDIGGHPSSFYASAGRSRFARHFCAKAGTSTSMVSALIVPATDRLQYTEQSMEKPIIEFMNDSSTGGPRMTQVLRAMCMFATCMRWQRRTRVGRPIFSSSETVSLKVKQNSTAPAMPRDAVSQLVGFCPPSRA